MKIKDKQEAERIAGELVKAHKFLNGNLHPDRLEAHKLAKAILLFEATVSPVLSVREEAHIAMLERM
jgi:hypothetical protein